MVGNVFYEHGHRLFAGSVAVFTLALLVTSLLERRVATDRSGRLPRLVPLLCGLALVLVLVQAVLGGLTVIYRLPTLVSEAHLCTSMLFFATIIVIACLSRPRLRHSEPGPLRDDVPRLSYQLLLLTTGLCYLQIALGGLVKHTGASLACLDVPLCQGSLLPLAATGTVIVQAVHRLNGLLLAVVMFVTLPRLRPQLRRQTDSLRRLLLVGLSLGMLLQIALGLLSVWARLELFLVIAHLGLGALLLGGLVVLCVELRAAPSSAAVGATGGLMAPQGGAA
jgi:heme A synthase